MIIKLVLLRIRLLIQLIDIKEELYKPFTQQDRIKQLQKEKAMIDGELDLDKQENTRNIEETNEEEMER